MTLTKRRRMFRWLLRAAVISLVLWVGLSALVAWRLTRRPRDVFVETVPQVEGVTIESHRLSTVDGEEIGAWFVPGKPGGGTVLLLHGYGAARSSGHMRRLLTALAQDGRGVMAISLRAHGDSTGEINDIGYSARHDVVAAVDFIEQARPGERIVLCGTSQGAAAAAFAAGDLGTRVHGYLLDSPYRDLKTAVWNRVDLFLPAGLNHAAYAGMRMWAPAFLPVPVADVDPLAYVARVPASVPVVIATGTRDRVATMEEAQALLGAVESHGKLVVFPEARHSRLFRSDPVLYRQTLAELLDVPAAGAAGDGDR